jgi:hypothetical protein
MTATKDPAVMACAIQSVPPSTDMYSHSQLQPHLRKSSTTVVGSDDSCASCAVDVIQKTPGCTSLTKQMSPCTTRGDERLFVYQLSFFVEFLYTSMLAVS